MFTLGEEKVLLAVGSAPCAYEDVEKAKALYPESELMAINGACTMFEDIQHMLAGHTVRATDFFNARQAAFPGAKPVRVHANWASPGRVPKLDFPCVTDWWDGTFSSGATSAGKAALIGLAMGFDFVILCGCPMDGSGYSFEEAKVPQDVACQRIGDPTKQDRSSIKRYKEKLVSYAQTTFKGKVFSMSGFTKLHLGLPPRAL